MTADSGLDGFVLTRMAAAKINLALHVVGQRADGHHLLESLVTFADAGDRIGISPDTDDRFTVSGPFAEDVPLSGDNLVLRARDLLRRHQTEHGAEAPPVHIHLEKNLPVASGIGGGSADAAATLQGLMALWKADPGADERLAMALKLGADVPMCLDGRPLISSGIGETLAALKTFPAFPMLLVNPRRAVSTPVIFRTLVNKTNSPMPSLDDARTTLEWLNAMQAMRNDLEPPARALEPSIAAVSAALSDTGPRLVRMSGSGATCFALYATDAERDAAAVRLSQRHPGWYVLACHSAAGGTNDSQG
ncbi:4-(cytidine 5'-diphospho)-2-C-methyl-D-erythritol kinase [Pararhizobium antarcticum]|uniref:4-diphosphocytidyl-2-C-methyl-D-erythritol kinase n=1 Tax=Pararhizobium antarcticum TaxID=1798805 RepID=A0A657LXA1_9HYPH|nr:4-(cytidine 5'-diphospho)-2-C-methyl-D-erythritol kinase [Pararhizobium antarcticum]OJF90438.1 4-diphosphocytidyl-2C-methyl-D-erythritol kinase [Rhizobium sp. 58]OJG00614.1 4-diphosphocytidyl-2C-methyl-D-erythritol kinase [Pararhizobium antarcticum]